MKRIFAFLAFALLTSAATSADAAFYGWSLSHSSTDPFANTGLPTGELDTLFLWFCTSNEGMSAAEMDLSSVPPGQVLAFNVMNGYLNAGTATHLLLAVGGCPQAPLVAGSVLILHFAPLAVCLAGANVTVDCSPNPQAWPHGRSSYTDAGLPLCPTDTGGCLQASVESQSWGTIKSLYR